MKKLLGIVLLVAIIINVALFVYLLPSVQMKQAYSDSTNMVMQTPAVQPSTSSPSSAPIADLVSPTPTPYTAEATDKFKLVENNSKSYGYDLWYIEEQKNVLIASDVYWFFTNNLENAVGYYTPSVTNSDVTYGWLASTLNLYDVETQTHIKVADDAFLNVEDAIGSAGDVGCVYFLSEDGNTIVFKTVKFDDDQSFSTNYRIWQANYKEELSENIYPIAVSNDLQYRYLWVLGQDNMYTLYVRKGDEGTPLLSSVGENIALEFTRNASFTQDCTNITFDIGSIYQDLGDSYNN